MADFQYQPMLPLGGDETPYRLLTTAGVQLISAAGREFLRVDGSTKPANERDVIVKVSLGNGAYYPHEGRIDFIDVSVDRATDTVLARSTIANPDGALIDGQLVTVHLEAAKPQERVMVPQSAILADKDGTYVFAVADGKAVVRRVKLGKAVGADMSVESGLEAGEQVVVQGIERLQPGMAVQASPLLPQGAN